MCNGLNRHLGSDYGKEHWMGTQLQKTVRPLWHRTHPPGFAVFTDEIRDGENAVAQPITGRANVGKLVACSGDDAWARSRINPSFYSLNWQINKIPVRNSEGEVQRETTYIFRDYTHMKCDPSVSCGWADGTGEADDSGEEDRLFPKTHQENVRR